MKTIQSKDLKKRLYQLLDDKFKSMHPHGNKKLQLNDQEEESLSRRWFDYVEKTLGLELIHIEVSWSAKGYREKIVRQRGFLHVEDPANPPECDPLGRSRKAEWWIKISRETAEKILVIGLP